MSNLAPSRSNQPGLPTPPRGDTIAQFATYAEAQRAVDYLSDNHFAVQAVTIVGVDLQMVERVTGRLTYSRVAMAGLLSGAWFGLFVGLLLTIFGSGQGISVFAAIIIGAGFGGLFGLISYSLTGGRRDFTSTSQIVAGEYRVLCLTEQASAATQLLNRLANEGGPRSRGDRPGGSPDGTATAPVTPAPSDPTVPLGAGSPAGPAGEPAPGERVPATGPTYSEMIERKKLEERAAAEQEARAAANAAANSAPAEPPLQ
jgi:hypothetical protein